MYVLTYLWNMLNQHMHCTLPLHASLGPWVLFHPYTRQHSPSRWPSSFSLTLPSHAQSMACLDPIWASMSRKCLVQWSLWFCLGQFGEIVSCRRPACIIRITAGWDSSKLHGTKIIRIWNTKTRAWDVWGMSRHPTEWKRCGTTTRKDQFMFKNDVSSSILGKLN